MAQAHKTFLDKRPYESFTGEDFAEADALLKQELEVVKTGMGHGELSIDSYTQVWEECYAQVNDRPNCMHACNMARRGVACWFLVPSCKGWSRGLVLTYNDPVRGIFRGGTTKTPTLSNLSQIYHNWPSLPSIVIKKNHGICLKKTRSRSHCLILVDFGWVEWNENQFSFILRFLFLPGQQRNTRALLASKKISDWIFKVKKSPNFWASSLSFAGFVPSRSTTIHSSVVGVEKRSNRVRGQKARDEPEPHDQRGQKCRQIGKEVESPARYVLCCQLFWYQ